MFADASRDFHVFANCFWIVRLNTAVGSWLRFSKAMYFFFERRNFLQSANLINHSRGFFLESK